MTTLHQLAGLAGATRRLQRLVFDGTITAEQKISLRSMEASLSAVANEVLGEKPGGEIQSLARNIDSMLAVQREFIRGDRKSSTIRVAKDLERRVDRAVTEALNDQPKLFT